jgi:hypothetical protein
MTCSIDAYAGISAARRLHVYSNWDAGRPFAFCRQEAIMRKLQWDARRVLLAVIATFSAGGIGWALWGREYGFVFAALVVLTGCVVSFFKNPVSS